MIIEREETQGAAAPVAPSGASMVEEFWTSRESLTNIREFARARRAGPWGTLGVVLARVVAAVPPTVTLPPTVGGRMSLNLFAALVAPSGGGKGACESAARDAVACSEDPSGLRLVDIPEYPLGSGEGIARTFRPAGIDDNEPNREDRALFSAPEIDTLAALFSRSGSTLEGELRKLYTGEPIGFNNAQRSTRVVVPSHSYRACLLVGVQPLRAQALLDGADGGTPQRFLWLPVTDPDAPDQAPKEPDQWVVRMPQPTWHPGSLTIPDSAHDAIDGARLARLRGEPEEGSNLDGHTLLTRLKVAAALMILDGRAGMNEDDWYAAGVVMAVSNSTRAAVQRAAAEQARKANRARALAAAEREEAIADRKLQRAREAIIRWLERAGEHSNRELARRLKTDIREQLDTALAELEDEGIVLTTEAKQGGRRHRLADAESDGGTNGTPV